MTGKSQKTRAFAFAAPVPISGGLCSAQRNVTRHKPFCIRPVNPCSRRHAAAVWMCAPQSNSKDDDTQLPKARQTKNRAVKELRSVLKKCSIFLIGPMGSGKSAVGRYLAREIGFRHLDTDEIIETLAKKRINEIFSDEGESHFRDLESAVLEQVSAFIACCVSTGGGIVIRKENWGKLHAGLVVYLDTPVDVLTDRLQGESENRPLLTDAESLRDRIKDILYEREHLYKQADVSVKCKAGQGVDEIGQEIILVLTNFIKSNPPKLSKLYPGSLPKQD